MAARVRSQTLRRILDVRAAGQAAAEMHLGRLSRDRLTLQRRETQVGERQGQEEAAWTAALVGGSFNLPLAGAWASAVQASRIELRQLSQRLDANEAEADIGRSELALALARVEVAQSLLDMDRRRGRARSEEVQLNALADRFAHLGRAR